MKDPKTDSEESDSSSDESDLDDAHESDSGDDSECEGMYGAADMNLILLRPQSDDSFSIITTSPDVPGQIGPDHIRWIESEHQHCRHGHPVGRVFQQIRHMLGLPEQFVDSELAKTISSPLAPFSRLRWYRDEHGRQT